MTLWHSSQHSTEHGACHGPGVELWDVDYILVWNTINPRCPGADCHGNTLLRSRQEGKEWHFMPLIQCCSPLTLPEQCKPLSELCNPKATRGPRNFSLIWCSHLIESSNKGVGSNFMATRSTEEWEAEARYGTKHTNQQFSVHFLFWANIFLFFVLHYFSRNNVSGTTTVLSLGTIPAEYPQIHLCWA